MPIQKNAGGSGAYIREPGEYRVKILEIKTGLSKKEKPMLTVVFETPDEKAIAGYFVKSVQFHMKALEQLKLACGLKITDQADKLVGKECGILVEAGEANSDGRVFMQIVGYGALKELSDGGNTVMHAHDDDEVPF